MWASWNGFHGLWWVGLPGCRALILTNQRKDIYEVTVRASNSGENQSHDYQLMDGEVGYPDQEQVEGDLKDIKRELEFLQGQEDGDPLPRYKSLSEHMKDLSSWIIQVNIEQSKIFK
ncbi:hypothetical protein JHK86_052096 [Glycine max]|nr:hypothetical protein JHK86_052096 [Glycine max]